jgi:large subunit ribosomal protein L27
MAHTKAGGTTKGNRDSVAKRLGIKLYGGQKAKPGNIIVRQKGSKIFPGPGTLMGNDFTVFSVSEGLVHFKTLKGKKLVEVING